MKPKPDNMTTELKSNTEALIISEKIADSKSPIRNEKDLKKEAKKLEKEKAEKEKLERKEKERAEKEKKENEKKTKKGTYLTTHHLRFRAYPSRLSTLNSKNRPSYVLIGKNRYFYPRGYRGNRRFDAALLLCRFPTCCTL